MKIFGTVGRSVMAFLLSATLWGTAHAQDRGTSDEAVAMVKRGVALVKERGADKALPEFNSAAEFHSKDLYVVASDLQGKVLAHGVNPRLIGKEIADMKDADGKEFVKEMIETAKSKGKGWVNYKYLNPVSKNVETKSAYLERVDNMYVLVGIYKQ